MRRKSPIRFKAFHKAVGQNIKKARLAAGLTQEGMAKFEFNSRHVQDLEAGRTTMTLETLYRLARAFKVTPQELIKNVD